MSDNFTTNRALPSLCGQRIVIIGGSSGIGYATADCALAEGAQVTIVSNNPARVKAAISHLGRSALGGVVNVLEEASVARFFGGIAAFDHLIYTVSDLGPHLLSASLTQRDSAAAAEALSVNRWGALMAIKHAQVRLSSNGSITLTDRFLAHRAREGSEPNTVFEHMTRSLAVDLAPLRVNAVRSAGTLADTRVRPEFVQQTQRLLIPRSAEPVEIAQAYLYLMRGSYTTGQVLVVDGGLTLL
jgi:NAD(P)-dependent dehydrogenase (short-subunit alcohol dehydrogenase family)